MGEFYKKTLAFILSFSLIFSISTGIYASDPLGKDGEIGETTEAPVNQVEEEEIKKGAEEVEEIEESQLEKPIVESPEQDDSNDKTLEDNITGEEAPESTEEIGGEDHELEDNQELDDELSQEEDQSELMAVGGLLNNFNATSEVFKLETVTQSTNSHTRVFYTWFDGPNLYFAIGSHNGGEVTNVFYQGSSQNSAQDIYFGTQGQNTLHINGEAYELYDPSHNYPKNPAKIWSVVNLGPQTLASEFQLGVTTALGGGHHVVFTLKIANDLQVYHKYRDEETVFDTVFDTAQSGSLDGNLGYHLYPIYTHKGEEYELIDIEIIHNNLALLNKGPDDLVGGHLDGQVAVIGSLKASAMITFIYKKIPKGKITITKIVQGYDRKDPGRKFDIFVKGPDGKEWTVRLEHGESKSIEGLGYGQYTIREVLPMNYKLVAISNENISLSKEALEATSLVTNKRDNDGWFYDEDERENKFEMGILVIPSLALPPKPIEEGDKD